MLRVWHKAKDRMGRGKVLPELRSKDGRGTAMNERFKLSDIDELIKRVRTEEVEIEISITTDEERITINPWKPFKYSCPYREVEP